MSKTTTDDLWSIRLAAARATDARTRLDAEILKARKSGASLRKIAEAAGMSYETVRRMAAD